MQNTMFLTLTGHLQFGDVLCQPNAEFTRREAVGVERFVNTSIECKNKATLTSLVALYDHR